MKYSVKPILYIRGIQQADIAQMTGAKSSMLFGKTLRQPDESAHGGSQVKFYSH